LIIKSGPDYVFDEDGINFRVFYVDKKIVVKAKALPHMVIQYGDTLSDTVNKAKKRLHRMKAPLE
jgi:putative lipase involved disintegration of autophagic bodies